MVWSIFTAMRAATVLVVALVAACRGRQVAAGSAARGDVTDSLDFSLSPRSPADSALLTPRVVAGPTVIIFWLPAADTLPADDQASALDDMTYYTERVAPLLERYNITLLPTNAETVYVSLPAHKQRTILLSGLDYPFGYVIVEPGGTERILSGVYADDELMDEIRAYFDLPDDSAATRPRITT